MKRTKLLFCIFLTGMVSLHSRAQKTDTQKEQPLYSLIDQYAQARETRDTLLLSQILTDNIDQLVSSGEWRRGIQIAKEGMLRSSSANPGDRTLKVDHVRFLNEKTALIDARYEIANSDGTIRKMWSTFIVINENNRWKITAIRNMLPAGGS
jgi:uncharacterized protein (TIGR02246 family)